jgi:hypothetical protein
MALIYRLYGTILIGVSCKHDAGSCWRFIAECLEQLKASHARHVHIGYDHSEFALILQHFKGLIPAFCGKNFKLSAELAA